jgi:hypothetical protein
MKLGDVKKIFYDRHVVIGVERYSAKFEVEVTEYNDLKARIEDIYEISTHRRVDKETCAYKDIHQFINENMEEVLTKRKRIL